MFPSKPLLTLILVISFTAVDASPLERSTGKATLGFTTRIKGSGIAKIADRDRARAQALKNAAHLGKRAIPESVSVTNAMAYTAEVGVGNPATYYTLLIDTGSSNTWVGASKAYKKTKTSKDTGNIISVTYGAGNFSGEEWIDTIVLGSGLVIQNQSIGVASSGSATGFSDIDGILGIGPANLTTDTVSNTVTVPTVMDNLFSQGMIPEEVLGIYYVPVSESSSGQVTFGGYDSSVVTSSVEYTALTTTSSASNYWGINQSVTYGGNTILSSTAGIVDTGTTLIFIASGESRVPGLTGYTPEALPSDAFEKYQSATGGKLDNTTGLLTITSSQYADLKTLTFKIGSTSYDLSPNAQIWPRSLNSAIGGNSSLIYLVVSDMGTPSGSGIDFIDGYTFLERFYSVFDTTNKRVGFASTKYTNATTN